MLEIRLEIGKPNALYLNLKINIRIINSSKDLNMSFFFLYDDDDISS